MVILVDFVACTLAFKVVTYTNHPTLHHGNKHLLVENVKYHDQFLGEFFWGGYHIRLPRHEFLQLYPCRAPSDAKQSHVLITLSHDNIARNVA